jgi:peroxiredoxin
MKNRPKTSRPTKQTGRCIGVSLLLLLFTAALAVAADTPQRGEAFPEIRLPVPESPNHRDYLGTGEGKHFSLSDIDGEFVLVQIFSMYCPHCQRDAPNANALFNKLTADPALNRNVKMLGIGAGNSAFEINIFKKKFNIEFPLFPDGDYDIHKELGEVRTPYFFLVKTTGENPRRVFFSRLGGIEDVDPFLKRLKKSMNHESE